MADDFVKAESERQLIVNGVELSDADKGMMRRAFVAGMKIKPADDERIQEESGARAASQTELMWEFDQSGSLDAMGFSFDEEPSEATSPNNMLTAAGRGSAGGSAVGTLGAPARHMRDGGGDRGGGRPRQGRRGMPPGDLLGLGLGFDGFADGLSSDTACSTGTSTTSTTRCSTCRSSTASSRAPWSSRRFRRRSRTGRGRGGSSKPPGGGSEAVGRLRVGPKGRGVGPRGGASPGRCTQGRSQ